MGISSMVEQLHDFFGAVAVDVKKVINRTIAVDGRNGRQLGLLHNDAASLRRLYICSGKVEPDY